MILFDKLKRVATYRCLRACASNWSGAQTLGWFLSHPGTVQLSGRILTFPFLGLSLPSNDSRVSWILEAHDILANLVKRSDAKIFASKEGLLVELEGLKLDILTANQLYILHEVFGEGAYRFEMPGPSIFIDVGMNTGLASIDFLNRHEGFAYGFELVPSTAAQAMHNRDLNPLLAECFTIESFGLLDRDENFDIAVAPEHSSINSLFPGFEELRTDRQTVQVKDSATQIREILHKHPDHRAVLKVDAEGAEYEVIAQLADHDLLAEFELIFLEWHPREHHSSDELKRTLMRSGFALQERLQPHSCGILVGFQREGATSNKILGTTTAIL
ncbi:MAG TPA: FkbM family methyltransferase [Fimbriimonadaceae bacterium]|nr:FkbM family methyltransferase [Fimbriimonadaceae bacterium]